MHALIAKWAPPYQRSLFSSIIYGGATAGLVVSMPISGLLAESSFLGGWPSVFYVFGLLGIVWFVMWSMLVYESPDVHPWISVAEKRLINQSIGRQLQHFEVFMKHSNY
jgi:MFS family permease